MGSLILDELERIKKYVLVWIAGLSVWGVAVGIVAFVAYDRAGVVRRSVEAYF